jgi:hypothetical protein
LKPYKYPLENQRRRGKKRQGKEEKKLILGVN